MFKIISSSIDQEINGLYGKHRRCGASLEFRGVVRDNHLGKKVEAIHYDAYQSMALKIGNSIIEEALSRFEVEYIEAIHRIGFLEVGEVSIWILVSGIHREGCYHASQFVIDHMKAQLPIWKKEYFVGQQPEWTGCFHCSDLSYLKRWESKAYKSGAISAEINA